MQPAADRRRRFLKLPASDATDIGTFGSTSKPAAPWTRLFGSISWLNVRRMELRAVDPRVIGFVIVALSAGVEPVIAIAAAVLNFTVCACAIVNDLTFFVSHALRRSPPALCAMPSVP